jgi:hypothetical protein
MHRECFNEWAKSKRQEHAVVTCGMSSLDGLIVVYCRIRWEDDTPKDKSKATYDTEEGYLNLGRIAGLSNNRGTSPSLL